MSYVIDVYRRELPPHKSYVEYLTFVAFFPHLVAGPIVRPRDLLPQLSAPPRFSAAAASQALLLIAIGLFKKVAIGDYLGLNLVDRVFDAPLQYSALECYVALVAYAVQIYCDFSGYTDIAIGSAALLGVRFPPNFESPYKAHNIIDFWRRWHISLSTWLRDYLYIPLGGNRRGRARTYLNLLITMLLGGLWHGANLTFVIWGALHGILLAGTRAFQELFGKGQASRRPGGARLVLQVLLTFHVVCFAWLFFRAKSLDHALIFLSQLASLSTFHPNLDARVLGVLAVGLISHYVPERWFQRVLGAFGSLPAPAQAAVLLTLALSVREMASLEAVPFVYFQF
jgi:alginate O-acetyltransferase complex protein AlgI